MSGLYGRVPFSVDEPLPDWHLVLAPGVACDVEWLFRAVLAEMQSAIGTHGYRRTPGHPKMENWERVAIVGEETGEAIGSLTYDKWAERGEAGLRIELKQTAATAIAALMGIHLANLGEEIARGAAGRAEGEPPAGEEEGGKPGGEGGGRSPRPAGRGAGSPGGDGAGPVVGRASGRRPGEPSEWYA